MSDWGISPDEAEIRELQAEIERLRAENKEMVRMLRNIIGDDEYLRIYAIEEAMHHPALNETAEG